jgi:hypothetical protein
MQPVPPEVWANFERRLNGMRVPPPQRPDYRKWVRFYFEFCHKYGHSTGAPASRGPFLAKLASKNQSVTQRSQASAAVGLLLEPASEPGATRPSPPATPIGSPCAPLNSQPAVLSSKCQFPLLTLLDTPDFTRLAMGRADRMRETAKAGRRCHPGAAEAVETPGATLSRARVVGKSRARMCLRITR